MDEPSLTRCMSKLNQSRLVSFPPLLATPLAPYLAVTGHPSSIMPLRDLLGVRSAFARTVHGQDGSGGVQQQKKIMTINKTHIEPKENLVQKQR